MKSFLAILAAALSIVSVSAFGEAMYTVTDLGTLGGSTSTAFSINETHQVAGAAEATSGDERAFVWTIEGGMRDLGTLGGAESRALSINDSSQVVGDASDLDGYIQAFIWDANTGMQDITSGATGSSYAWGINNSGMVVGRDGDLQAFLWENDVLTPLPVPPGVPDSDAMGINDGGQIVGTAGDAVVLWEDGNITPIGYYWWPNGINSGGQVIGEVVVDSYVSDGKYYPGGTKAALWTDGHLEVIHTLGGADSYPYGINDAGHVVGLSATVWSTWGAFLWTSYSGMVDLNDLIDPFSGWLLDSAYDISNDGRIVGQGVNPQGFLRGFLLTPVRTLGDVDLSGLVDDNDLSLLLANWSIGDEWGEGDLNDDGTVDDDDLSLLLANWGAGSSPAPEAVPEPATLSLLILGGYGLILRRRK